MLGRRTRHREGEDRAGPQPVAAEPTTRLGIRRGIADLRQLTGVVPPPGPEGVPVDGRCGTELVAAQRRRAGPCRYRHAAPDGGIVEIGVGRSASVSATPNPAPRNRSAARENNVDVRMVLAPSARTRSIQPCRSSTDGTTESSSRRSCTSWGSCAADPDPRRRAQLHSHVPTRPHQCVNGTRRAQRGTRQRAPPYVRWHRERAVRHTPGVPRTSHRRPPSGTAGPPRRHHHRPRPGRPARPGGADRAGGRDTGSTSNVSIRPLTSINWPRSPAPAADGSTPTRR